MKADTEVKVSTGTPFVIGLVLLAGVVAVPLSLLWVLGNDEAPAVEPVSVVSVSVPPSVPGCAMFCREDELQHESASVAQVPGCVLFCREGEVAR
ncbi:hypothetical protein IU453_00975 [Nocardia cyriacigeorgica]|uniref:hypothetical protein n=1 Tax=Nocardia cyriacigeorgica TaxID=135487 RepID=UPI0018937103|nr:hypothetical protein [Nocardia cyriacigeorgica]MBF6092356.1 hypothetical protein [Nocardia cyriacigeorgica]MBF6162908.1 hypothetical protein [Nocardia cyriacigeorgica]MBF6201792.1 hypothetical protein [Nocardia cyriacigeorgica]MBF6315357.1 hypothetical protein [Nocardia cyriacigeorgica]MBF6530143.1 hypothetical protein [Nocardia cyriacigeorgica]